MPEQHGAKAVQPITFGGVARFAHARFGRLCLVTLLFAALCSSVIVWFAEHSFFPVVEQAISNLPPNSRVYAGSLEWPSSQNSKLGENSWLSIIVEPNPDKPLTSTSDFELKLRKNEIRLRSLLGFTAFQYPRDYLLLLNREELGPRWAAWKPAMLALVALSSILWLLCSWTLLAILYAPLSRLIAFFADRQVTFLGIIKMNVAAMLPAGLFMTTAIWLYSMMELNLPGLLLAGAVHFLMQILYVHTSIFFLPKAPDAPKPNPFVHAAEKNPFNVK